MQGLEVVLSTSSRGGNCRPLTLGLNTPGEGALPRLIGLLGTTIVFLSYAVQHRFPHDMTREDISLHFLSKAEGQVPFCLRPSVHDQYGDIYSLPWLRRH